MSCRELIGQQLRVVAILAGTLAGAGCASEECLEPSTVILVPGAEKQVRLNAEGRIPTLEAALQVFKSPVDTSCHRLGVTVTVEPVDPAAGTLSHAILEVNWSSNQEAYDWIATASPGDIALQVDAFRDCGNGESSGDRDEYAFFRIILVTDYSEKLLVRVEPSVELCAGWAGAEPDIEFVLRP